MTTTTTTTDNQPKAAQGVEGENETTKAEYDYYCEDETNGEFSTDGSDSDESSFDDDDDDDDDSKEDELARAADEKAPGIFISRSTAKFLRGLGGSDGALNRYLPKELDPHSQPLNRMRRDSDNGASASGIVMVVQTVSSTAGTTYKGMSTQDDEDDGERNLSPFKVLKTIIASSYGDSCKCSYPAKSIEGVFVKGDIHAHTVDLMGAVRNNDLHKIQQLHEAGHVLQCCNRFGESIVHTAARRGSYEVLRFLKDTAGVSLRVCCDTGRNPMHDACWTGTPNFDVVRYLVMDYPDFFCMADNRGFTPLEYVPKDAWKAWRAFLRENSHTIELQRPVLE